MEPAKRGRAPSNRAQEFIPSTIAARCFSNHPAGITMFFSFEREDSLKLKVSLRQKI
jgi:hypothetical protein